MCAKRHEWERQKKGKKSVMKDSYCERQEGREQRSLVIAGQLGQDTLENNHKLQDNLRKEEKRQEKRREEENKYTKTR